MPEIFSILAANGATWGVTLTLIIAGLIVVGFFSQKIAGVVGYLSLKIYLLQAVIVIRCSIFRSSQNQIIRLQI